MKKVFKGILYTALIAALAVAAYWGYHKYIAKHDVQDAMSVIPEDAVFVVETSDLSEAWTTISESKVWKFLIKNPYFKDINKDIEMLNSYLSNSAAGLVLDDRKLLLSAHMVSGTDWDMLYVADMKDAASMLDDGLKTMLGAVEGYKIKEREYKKQSILELSSGSEPSEIIYMTINDNLLTVSFSGSLLEKSIDQKEIKPWENNPEFKEVTENLGGNQLFRFYFNYGELNKFTKAYLTEESETIGMLSTSLFYSALDINLEDEILRFEGYTNIDSVGSYIKALADVKPGKFEAWKIMSDETALYLSLGFDNYMNFYNNLIEQYRSGNTEDMEDIEKNVQRLEKYLKINLEEHFFDWIGNEIAVVKMNPGKNTRPEDLVVAFHTKDVEQAKEGMAHIMKMIKRRTPTKFESETYKNFELHKFERRDFFKIFFGKMFKKLEKPYFTFIEEYMIMSNSVDVLKKVVDDYITGNTLERREKFIDFKDEFSPKANVTILIRSPKIYQNLYYYSTKEDREALKKNRDFILSFSQIGFQLESSGQMFDTKFLAKHDPDAVAAEKLEQTQKELTADLFRDEVESLSFKVELPAAITETDTLYEGFYDDDSKAKLKIKGRIEDEKLTGIWKTFYESGNIKSSVNYIEGKIEGEAFFYYDDESQTLRATAMFDDDKIINRYEENYKSGARKAMFEYNDGKADGDAEFYYPSGKLKIKAGYKEGQKHGRWIYYNENGDKIGKERWRKGVLKNSK